MDILWQIQSRTDLVTRGYFGQNLPRRRGPHLAVPERPQRRRHLPGRGGGAKRADSERLERRPVLRRGLGDPAEAPGFRGRRCRRRQRGRPLLLEGVLLVPATRASGREVEERLLRCRGHPAAPPPRRAAAVLSPSSLFSLLELKAVPSSNIIQFQSFSFSLVGQEFQFQDGVESLRFSLLLWSALLCLTEEQPGRGSFGKSSSCAHCVCLSRPKSPS